MFSLFACYMKISTIWFGWSRLISRHKNCKFWKKKFTKITICFEAKKVPAEQRKAIAEKKNTFRRFYRSENRMLLNGVYCTVYTVIIFRQFSTYWMLARNPFSHIFVFTSLCFVLFCSVLHYLQRSNSTASVVFFVVKRKSWAFFLFVALCFFFIFHNQPWIVASLFSIMVFAFSARKVWNGRKLFSFLCDTWGLKILLKRHVFFY